MKTLVLIALFSMAILKPITNYEPTNSTFLKPTITVPPTTVNGNPWPTPCDEGCGTCFCGGGN